MTDCSALPRFRRQHFCKIGMVSILYVGLGWTLSRAQTKVPVADSVNADHAAKMSKGLEIFKQYVRPILMQRCVKCHGGKMTESEFDLTDREKLFKGGTTGPAVVGGNSKDSLLYKLITHAQETHMPHHASNHTDAATRATASTLAHDRA